MASFCIDEDVTPRLADLLTAAGHNAISVKRETSLRGGGDQSVLLVATSHGRIVVTHNEADFKLLHRAWVEWPLPFAHPGILVIPQSYLLSAEAMTEQIDGFFRAGPDLANHLFVLQQRPPGSLSYRWEESLG